MNEYEYERELVERVENDSFQKGNPIVILMAVAEDKGILDLVSKVGDDKHRSIADTIRDIKKSTNRYRKVTTNQKRAIALHLVEKFGTARAALAAAAGVTEQEMFGGNEEPAEVTEEPASTVAEAPAEATTIVAAEIATFLGFRPLKGSEKQIAWATKIRAQILKYTTPEQTRALADHKRAGLAKWWIDHRPMRGDEEDGYGTVIQSMLGHG